jgi:hypothetical protein
MFYRFRQWYHYKRFTQVTEIFSSAPMNCDPDAACAIHTMVSAKDLPLYLVAIKSLLHFYPSVAVVIHSDGSLGKREAAVLQGHVPGCKVISAAEADARARDVLGPNSPLWTYRGWDAAYRRLIDTELWNSTRKRIIMDSDILVLSRPHEVIEWIENGQVPLLFGQPNQGSVPPTTTGKKHVQTIFRENVGTLSRQLGLPDYFPQGATGGFYGTTGKELSLEKIEQVIRHSVHLEIPMWEWGGDQCVEIYLLAAAGARRLHPDLYLNFDFGLENKAVKAHIVHFLGHCRFHKNLYPNRAARLVHDLTRPSLAPA